MFPSPKGSIIGANPRLSSLVDTLGQIVIFALVICLFYAGGCMSMNAQQNEIADLMIFDFNDDRQVEKWRTINDTVMGGVSSSSFVEVDSGHARFTGTVSLENNGGFASVRSQPISQNLSECDGLMIRVKGDGQAYKFSLKLDQNFDGVLYQHKFLTVRDNWIEITLPFKDFVPTYRGRVLDDVSPIDAAQIQTLGLMISEKQEGPFVLDVAWIKGIKSASGG